MARLEVHVTPCWAGTLRLPERGAGLQLAAQRPADPRLEAFVTLCQLSGRPAAPLCSPLFSSGYCHTPAAASSCTGKEAAADFSPI